jgi:hypothetical protein
MNKLSKEEFTDRMEAIQRSREIFINSGITKNISIAFELYQKIFASQERKLTLNANIDGNRSRTIMDDYNRPSCPDCKSDMMFRVIPENEEGIKTQLVCSKCDLVLDSDKDLKEWMHLLKVKNV